MLMFWRIGVLQHILAELRLIIRIDVCLNLFAGGLVPLSIYREGPLRPDRDARLRRELNAVPCWLRSR